MDPQVVVAVDAWIEQQPCHQAFWLRNSSRNEQAPSDTQEPGRRLVALQAICFSLTTIILRSAIDHGSSPQHSLSMLKRIKHAALCDLQQSQDASLVGFADIYLSALITDLYERFASTRQE